MTIGIIIFAGILCIGGGILFFFREKKRQLTPTKQKYFSKELKKIQQNPSFSTQIIDLDTLLHQILQEMGYSGSFGQILKQNPKIIPDINAIWKYHKLRNSLVHTLEKRSPDFWEDAAGQYTKEIQKILGF